VSRQDFSEFWSLPERELLALLETSRSGLDSGEARRRLGDASIIEAKGGKGVFRLLLSQFKSPIILILLFATGLSFFLHDPFDAIIILSIVAVSGFLGFFQEYGANETVKKLMAVLKSTSRVLRDGLEARVPSEEIVTGDAILLAAGDGIPGDCCLLESKNLFADEAVLTGETFPAEKSPGIVPVEAPPARRTNTLFAGTHVVSGTGRAVVVRTGKDTEFGKIAGRLRLKPPETEFQRGVRRFGSLLLEITLMLVIAIFAVNVFLHRHVLDSFLFSLALAVGLTPQLLPVIISINLSHGAKGMAAKKVIVKRLASIENFGSMDVLCSDKTGTLTEGVVRVRSALSPRGAEDDRVLLCAFLNSAFVTGFTNPIDEAIRTHGKFDLSEYTKIDEVPYDFVRKRLSVLLSVGGRGFVVTKGAVTELLGCCTNVAGGLAEGADQTGAGVLLSVINGASPIEEGRDRILARFESMSGEGYRLIGVAVKGGGTLRRLSREDENGMTFAGFIVLHDPLKRDVAGTVRELQGLGVSLKIVSGDNRFVVETVAKGLGLKDPRVLTGGELRRASDAALLKLAGETDAFAEIEPNQKERIILALKKSGHVVGYLGDGINDAPALHSADVGISVNGAVSVAKEAADIVLLEKDLGVLRDGILTGRHTFANTLKYVFMASSANFGNMFSMAGASLFLPFLPLLPKQILLTNLLTDVPEMTIASDHVDDEMVKRPRKWNIGFIRSFMLVFGVLSSFFDYATFAALRLIFRAGEAQFRTGWFVESVVSASLVVLVVRTRRFFLRSRPRAPLALATLSVVAFAAALPYTPIAHVFGLVPVPPRFLFSLAAIVAAYILSAEFLKRIFYRRVKET
jgi:Mg2+-importing ATPase